jgi:hypothetical protein
MKGGRVTRNNPMKGGRVTRNDPLGARVRGDGLAGNVATTAPTLGNQSMVNSAVA